MTNSKESWQQARIQYLMRLRPDRLAAGASITEPRLRIWSSWLEIIEYGVLGLVGGAVLGMLCALWLIWMVG